MPTVVEYDNQRAGCYLGESASPNIVNEEIIVADGEDILKPGTVLGKITSSGKYVAHDNALSNGGQNAVAILFSGVDATNADAVGVATVNGPGTINGHMLIFKSGISAANKTAAIDALRDKGMKVLPQHAS